MSSSNVLQLPSFDRADNAIVVESEPIELEVVQPLENDLELVDLGEPGLTDVEVSEGDFASIDLGDAEDHWEPEPAEPPASKELSEPVVDETAERLTAAEQLLEELAGSADMLQLEVAARVEKIVQDMTTVLFPKLAEDFLAEEVSRFLAYAVPKDALRVDVNVPAPLEAGLTERVLRNKSLRDFCLVHTLPAGAEPRVTANWGEGGFEYDLTSLLAACHARTIQNGIEIED